MKKLCEIFEISIGTIEIIALIIAALYVFGLVLQELAPFVTLLVVLLFTLHTFKRWADALMAICGIALYAISWYVVHFWGDVSAQLLCSAGLFLWLAAVGRSFIEDSMKIQESSS